MRRLLALSALAVCAGLLLAQQPQPKPDYVKKGNRGESVAATHAAFGLPTLQGKWHYAGPFDHPEDGGFDTQYPPEKGPFDAKATFTGKGGATFGWKELPKFQLGSIYDLTKLFDTKSDAVVYVHHEFEAKEKCSLPLSLGTDDTLSVYFNGKRLLHENHKRPAAPDQDEVLLEVKPGKNQLLLRVGQYGGGWELYAAPEPADLLPRQARVKLDNDFPRGGSAKPAKPANNTEEAKFYKMFTLPVPADCALEVGGLAFRPDGKLLACTRRGEVWLIDNPTSESLPDIKFSKYASGMHEALGLWVEDDKTVYVVQRPELTKLVDKSGTGKTATEFSTFCDKWGVSGDYHEYAFGPARDPKTGDFYITLNVGFGGGHQAKGAWRGWCVRVDGKTGDLEPFCYGIRSPNGVNFSPEGDLFYTDNQGEWVATNKMHHLQKGKFYGHQAGLRWVKDSPFAGKVSEKVASGMMYDGQPAPGKTAPKGMPELSPPCVWFPYGRMGQSISEPIWDTTKGKFGPFSGQCFVGDQYTAVVMRVAMEKVNGVYQGACFPFRAGFQCGVNRLTFGPDGALYVGQTNRGWGSLGGKPHGLQRISFTGADPMEVHHVTLTKDGFDFTFTKPVDPETVTAKAMALKSFTYVYSSQYGYPETDTRPEAVSKVSLSADKKTVSLSVADLKPGRVYDFKWNGVKALSGEALLHPEAYYTLNELVK